MLFALLDPLLKEDPSFPEEEPQKLKSQQDYTSFPPESLVLKPIATEPSLRQWKLFLIPLLKMQD
jgi:hypothetical protein